MSKSLRRARSQIAEALTPQQFCSSLEIMRPALLSFACRSRPCQEEDAEDLVQDAVCDALRLLPWYDPLQGSLANWMRGLLRIVILRDRQNKLSTPDTVPLVYALAIPANPNERLRDAIWPHLERLSAHLRDVVNYHLDGYTQEEIASAIGISTNTVANRIALAGQELALEFVDFEDEWNTGMFDGNARHAVYRRPNGMATYWRRKGPRGGVVRAAGAEMVKERAEVRLRVVEGTRSVPTRTGRGR